MKNELYDWQGNTMWAVGILTSIAILYDFETRNGPGASPGFRWGLLLDFVVGIGINILILWLVFKLGNWVYRKAKNNK